MGTKFASLSTNLHNLFEEFIFTIIIQYIYEKKYCSICKDVSITTLKNLLVNL